VRPDRDVTAVKRHLPPFEAAPKVHAAFRRLTEKARRFDNALQVLLDEPLPDELQELARRIVEEIRA
jgi:hypothetical protein